MIDVKLPNWEHAAKRVRSGYATPIEQFIYTHEPPGKPEERKWRHDLRNAIRCAMGSKIFAKYV